MYRFDKMLPKHCIIELEILILNNNYFNNVVSKNFIRESNHTEEIFIAIVFDYEIY